MWNGIKLIQIETNVFQVSPYVSHLTIYIYLSLSLHLSLYLSVSIIYIKNSLGMEAGTAGAYKQTEMVDSEGND